MNVLTMPDEGGVPELMLYGDVGDDFWDGFTAADVIAALATAGRSTDIAVRINSGGGLVFDGVAIYNALKAHAGSVAVYVDGMALSAASIIAMAGDTVTMRKGAVMMIHDPCGFTIGNPADHEKSLEWLTVVADSMADIYAERTGMKPDEARALMQAETWLTGDQAKAKGFADAVEEEAPADPVAFDYRIYAHAPKRLTALAKKKGWDHPRAAAENWKCAAANDLPIDDSDTWDGSAAAERILADAGFDGDNPDPAKAKSGFLAWDSANPNLKGSYKLPFADLVGGELKAVAGGLRAAASRLPQTDLPQSVKDAARAVLDGYFEKLNSEKETAMAEKELKEAVAAAQARASAIIATCTAAGFSALAAKLIEAGADDAAVTAKIEEAKTIKATVETARSVRASAVPENALDGYLAAGKTLAEVKADLFDKTSTSATEDPAIRSHHSATNNGQRTAAGLDVAKVYALHNGATSA